jgi:Tfp pilus assembly protein PilV
MTISRTRPLRRHQSKHGHRRRGLSIVEAAISVVLVGVMLVAALNAAGASKLAQAKLSNRGRGMLLAQELMTEILAQAYEDSTLATGSFGRTGAKSAPGDRSLFDDVDDYYDWSASPPEEKDGTVKPDLTGWSRSVVVAWVNASNVKTVIGANQGVKRITVTVRKNDMAVAELVAFRAAGGDTLLAARID